MVVVRMISPKTGFLSFGKVLERLLNSSVLRNLAPYRSCSKRPNAVTSFRSQVNNPFVKTPSSAPTLSPFGSIAIFPGN